MNADAGIGYIAVCACVTWRGNWLSGPISVTVKVSVSTTFRPDILSVAGVPDFGLRSA